MSKEDRDVSAQIDDLVRRFFAAFDNRGGRVPDMAGTAALFADKAVVAKQQDGQCTSYSPAEFLAPRMDLLANGTLTDFHEWETSADTRVFGSMAVRVSRYGKSGIHDAAPYAGGGTKIFQLAAFDCAWKIVSLSWVDDA